MSLYPAGGRRILRPALLCAVALASCVLGALAHAQTGGQSGNAPTQLLTAAPSCETSVIRSGGGALHGLNVQTLAVLPEGPIAKGGPLGMLRRLRATTLTGVVQRYLQFAPGEKLDSTRVAETLRQLRRSMLFNDVWLESVVCGHDVNLAVHTRDTWSLRPNARVAPPDYALSLEDRNIFGSGRRLAVAESHTQYGNGASIAAIDPFVFGHDIQASARLSNVGDRRLATFGLRSNALSVFEPWQFEAVGFVSKRPDPLSALPTTSLALVPPAPRIRATHTVVGQLLIARRIYETPAAVIFVQGGAEFDSLSISTRFADSTLSARGRHLQLVDLGFARRAAKFDTVSWFAPGKGFLDVPAVTEANVVIGVGRDRQSHRSVARYDGWVGRVWRPSRGELLTTDVWASGLAGEVATGINRVERVAFSYYREAWRGFWGIRALDEFIEFAEADLRARVILSPTIDPTFPAVPVYARQPAHTVAISGERSLHLRTLTANAILDGALFASASVRAGIVGRGNEQVRVAILGARLRILSANGTPSSTRLDFGCPVLRSATVSGRCFVGISLGPLFDANRRRDGYRLEQ